MESTGVASLMPPSPSPDMAAGGIGRTFSVRRSSSRSGAGFFVHLLVSKPSAAVTVPSGRRTSGLRQTGQEPRAGLVGSFAEKPAWQCMQLTFLGPDTGSSFAGSSATAESAPSLPAAEQRWQRKGSSSACSCPISTFSPHF